MQAAKQGAVDWGGSRLLHNLNAAKEWEIAGDEAFPTFSPHCRCFSLSELQKQHSSRTEINFSNKKICLTYLSRGSFYP